MSVLDGTKVFATHDEWQQWVSSVPDWGQLDTDWLQRLDPHKARAFDDCLVLLRASEESHKYSVGFLYPDTNRKVIGTIINPSTDENDEVIDRDVSIEDNGTIWFRTGKYRLILRKDGEEWVVRHARSKLDIDYEKALDLMFGRNTWTCDSCGRESHVSAEPEEVEGSLYCAECADHIITCSYCGATAAQTNLDYYHADVCPDCVDRMVHCSDCGDLTDIDDVYTVQYGDEVCEDCYNDNYQECNGCGDIFRSSYGRTRCSECGDIIQGYHHTNARYFYTLDGRTDQPQATVRYYGTELEIEASGDRYDVAESVDKSYDSRVIDMKEDGSLDDGFEIVHQPASLQYYQKNYGKILQVLRYHGCLSHDTSTCGYHIHISRHNLTPHQEIKMAYFIMEYPNFMKKFSRRSYGGYCERTRKSLDYSARESRGRDAFSFCNRDTIEFRMPKGTLNEETYLATLEFLDALAKFCEMTDMRDFHNEQDIMQRFIRLAEYAVRKYPNLYKYLDRRNIPQMYDYRPKRKLERTVFDEGDYAVVKDHSEQESK